MRNMKGLVAIAMAVATTGCVESVDQGYGYSNGYYGNGYSNGYYGRGYSSGYYPTSSYYSSPGYYAAPRVNNYYYNPSPTVVTQTRYVPVPTPVPVPVRQADRDDHRWWRHRDNPQPQQPPQHVDRPHNPPPQASNPQPNNSGDNNRHHGNWRDRNGDGQPDRRS